VKINRIAALYAVEKEARYKPAEERAALRQEKAKPVFEGLEAWLQLQLPRISGKSTLAEAIRYAPGRMPKARACLENGQLELDNNICGRSIRPVTPGRQNYLFMGSKGGGEASAIACTLIECDAVSRTYPPMYDISIFSTAGRSPRVIALLNSEYRSPLARQIWAMAVEISSSEHPPRINARRSWPPVANRHV